LAGLVPIYKEETQHACLFVETGDFSCLMKPVMTAQLLILQYLFRIANQIAKEASLDGLALEERAQLLLLAVQLVGTA